jgi:thiol-disulfide isomerase/thioredoxin
VILGRAFGALALMCAPAFLSAEHIRVGGSVPAFSLADLKGAPVSFSASASKVTVVLFISTKCPVSNRYNQRMIGLYQEYEPKGVRFVFVNANQNESPEEVAAHASQAAFPFPVYKDEGNLLADRLDAQATPEAYVIDGAGVLRYHGRVDDAQNPARVKENSLKLAIESVLAGREVGNAETKAFGCTIKRVPRTS